MTVFLMSEPGTVHNSPENWKKTKQSVSNMKLPLDYYSTDPNAKSFFCDIAICINIISSNNTAAAAACWPVRHIVWNVTNCRNRKKRGAHVTIVF